MAELLERITASEILAEAVRIGLVSLPEERLGRSLEVAEKSCPSGGRSRLESSESERTLQLSPSWREAKFW